MSKPDISSTPTAKKYKYTYYNRSLFQGCKLSTRQRQVVVFTPHFLYPWRKRSWYPLDRSLIGPQIQSGHGEEEKKNTFPAHTWN
jgi:hypothetical protein